MSVYQRILKTLLPIAIFALGIPFVAGARASVTEKPGVAGDTLTVSLMTCEPGTAIYELYGHTAIRVQTRGGIDVVFNYGMFDFAAPNFVWRFVLGKTDYHMAAFAFDDFITEYLMRGSAVHEQVLNLTANEKLRLWRSLLATAQQKNWTYRYNFLYDNCTTRARDEIEQCLDGYMEYHPDTTQESYRQIIHSYTRGYRWSEFGQDLLLGNAADVSVSQRQKMFAPLYTMKCFGEAAIVGKTGSRRPLLSGEAKVYNPIKSKKEAKGFPLSPVAAFAVLLALTVVVCVAEIRTGKIFWPFSVMLMAVQGLAGCIIATLFFFSEHPTVNTNWLLLIFNPIPLICIVPRVAAILKRRYDVYPLACLALILLFAVLSLFISQSIPLPIYCFALSLLLQAAVEVYLHHKAKWKRCA